MEKVNAGIALKWLGQIKDILKSLFMSVYHTENGSEGYAQTIANGYVGYVMTGKLPDWSTHPLRPKFGSVVYWMRLCESIIGLQYGRPDMFCLLYNTFTDAVKSGKYKLIMDVDIETFKAFLEGKGWVSVQYSYPAWAYQLNSKESGFHQVLIPKCKELSDYASAMERAVNTVAKAHWMQPVDVLLNIQGGADDGPQNHRNQEYC